jgi:hypothetical protein
MKPLPKNLVAWLKEFLAFSMIGIGAGAGVGFFMFLRLGFPKETYMIGYMSGLFIGSGVKLGISLWFVHIIFRSLLHLWAQGSFCGSHYHFRDMDLQPGHFDSWTSHQTPQPVPNLHSQLPH